MISSYFNHVKSSIKKGVPDLPLNSPLHLSVFLSVSQRGECHISLLSLSLLHLCDLRCYFIIPRSLLIVLYISHFEWRRNGFRSYCIALCVCVSVCVFTYLWLLSNVCVPSLIASYYQHLVLLWKLSLQQQRAPHWGPVLILIFNHSINVFSFSNSLFLQQSFFLSSASASLYLFFPTAS